MERGLDSGALAVVLELALGRNKSVIGGTIKISRIRVIRGFYS